MINVLFVCLGNICRSPMADAVFQDKVQEAGLSDKISVDSAGTGGWHAGESAHRGTLKVLKKHGIAYNGRARQFKDSDLSEFDYILAMDLSNLNNIERMAGRNAAVKIALFLHYAQEAGTIDEDEVPDPYYTGQFDYVYDLVNKGADALLNHIRREHNL
jgi:protein-tyrosine phosphatase